MSLEVPSNFGSYRVTARLGRGGMGVVYRAFDTRTEREVALKVMLADATGDENARARFVREAQAVARLQHRNIVTVHECGVFDDSPYIAMELLSGTSLAAQLASGEPMPLDTKLDILIQLCEGLQFAHDSGIVHRDVKPANIWLLTNGGVKLLDFGIAKIAGATLTRSGGVVGSAAYMSPEQLAGAEVDGRTDIFAAGAILYELLTGRRAFDADSVTAVMHKILHEPPPPVRAAVPDLPADVEAALEIALKKDPAERFERAADFGDELRLSRYRLARPAAETVAAPRRSVPAAAPAPAPATDAPAAAISVPASQAIVPAPTVIRAPQTAPARAPVAPPTTIEERARTVRRELLTQWARVPAEVKRGARWAAAAFAAAVVVALVARAVPGMRAPITFSVEVTSVPAGAGIAFDGRSTGQRTPATVSLTAWPSRVAVSLPGFETVEAAMPVAPPDHRLRLAYALRRMLRVQSDPPGARVSIDGRDTGLITPADVPLPDPPPGEIEVRLSDRVRRLAPVTSAVLSRGQLHVTFETPTALPASQTSERPSESPPPRSVVSVRITGGYPFEVTGCGTRSPSATDHALQVTAPCTLRLRAPAYWLDTSRFVEASSGQVELAAPQLARVQLRTRYEWCTVILSGHAVGSPPIDLELAAGTYTATIQCPDKTYSTQAFSIDPGRSIRRLDDLLR